MKLVTRGVIRMLLFTSTSYFPPGTAPDVELASGALFAKSLAQESPQASLVCVFEIHNAASRVATPTKAVLDVLRAAFDLR